MDFSTDVLVAVVRESVSSFVLLVFLFFSYKLMDRAIGLIDKYGERVADSLDRIADKE